MRRQFLIAQRRFDKRLNGKRHLAQLCVLMWQLTPTQHPPSQPAVSGRSVKEPEGHLDSCCR